jgi:hypothetical protein
MDLSQLAETPKLLKLQLDSDTIIKKYGEPVEFWMYDRQSIPTYIKLSQLENDTNELIDVVQQLVMNEQGKPMLKADQTLPLDIMMAMVERVVTELGNGVGQTMKDSQPQPASL